MKLLDQINRNDLNLKIMNTIEDSLEDKFSSLELQYPKFYKMNIDCQLAFLAIEILVERNKIFFNQADSSKIGTLFCNTSSSFYADIKHATAIHSEIAVSPSIFVYTLPSLIQGELSIRHQWLGHSSFFIFENKNQSQMKALCHLQMKEYHLSAIISGWVEMESLEISIFTL